MNDAVADALNAGQFRMTVQPFDHVGGFAAVGHAHVCLV
jgi:hypothetical protein